MYICTQNYTDGIVKNQLGYFLLLCRMVQKVTFPSNTLSWIPVKVCGLSALRQAERQMTCWCCLSWVKRGECLPCCMPDKCSRFWMLLSYLKDCVFPQSVDAEWRGSWGDWTSWLCGQPADILLWQRGTPTTHPSKYTHTCTHLCYMYKVHVLSLCFTRTWFSYCDVDTHLMSWVCSSKCSWLAVFVHPSSKQEQYLISQIQN